MGTLKEEPLVRARVRTFEPIHEGIAQGVVALLGGAFVLLGEVFYENGGRHNENSKLELRNWKLEFGIANWFVSSLGGFSDGGEDV